MTTKIKAIPGTILNKRRDFIRVQLANGRMMSFSTTHQGLKKLTVGKRIPKELLGVFESLASRAPEFKNVTLE